MTPSTTWFDSVISGGSPQIQCVSLENCVVLPRRMILVAWMLKAICKKNWLEKKMRPKVTILRRSKLFGVHDSIQSYPANLPMNKAVRWWWSLCKGRFCFFLSFKLGTSVSQVWSVHRAHLPAYRITRSVCFTLPLFDLNHSFPRYAHWLKGLGITESNCGWGYI